MIGPQAGNFNLYNYGGEGPAPAPVYAAEAAAGETWEFPIYVGDGSDDLGLAESSLSVKVVLSNGTATWPWVGGALFFQKTLGDSGVYIPVPAIRFEAGWSVSIELQSNNPADTDVRVAVVPLRVAEVNAAGQVALADTQQVQLSAAGTAALLAALESDLIDDETHQAVMAAIVAKLAASFPDLDDLTLEAIGAAARDAILDRVLADNHDVAGSVGKILQDAALDAAAAMETAGEIDAKLADGGEIYEALDQTAADVAGLDGEAMRGTDDALPAASYTAPPSAAANAAAVWASPTRTLTSFGSLVASVAAAVWTFATRTLSGTARGLGPTAAAGDEDGYFTCRAGATRALYRRIANWDGGDLTRAGVSSIAYTIYALDGADPPARTAVAGHANKALVKTDVLFDDVRSDEAASDYNFRHIPDVSAHPAFPAAATTYHVEYKITPASGQVITQRIVVRTT